MAARTRYKHRGRVVSLGDSRMTAGSNDVVATPGILTATNPVVMYHGYNETAVLLAGRSWFRRDALALCGAGYSVVAPTTQVGTAETTTVGWGNAASVTRGVAGDTYHRASLLGTGKRVVWGVSMGAQAAVHDAISNPSNVACIILVIPAIDLEYLRVNFPISFRAAIDACWGVTYPTIVPAGANALDRAADLAGLGMPIYVAGASDDIIETNIATFVTNSGAEYHDVGALGHTDAAQNAVDMASVLRFIAAHLT